MEEGKTIVVTAREHTGGRLHARRSSHSILTRRRARWRLRMARARSVALMRTFRPSFLVAPASTPGESEELPAAGGIVPTGLAAAGDGFVFPRFLC